ncbi:unnamed protein product, partial [Musa acuminata subsp. burmannicoides]
RPRCKSAITPSSVRITELRPCDGITEPRSHTARTRPCDGRPHAGRQPRWRPCV